MGKIMRQQSRAAELTSALRLFMSETREFLSSFLRNYDIQNRHLFLRATISGCYHSRFVCPLVSRHITTREQLSESSRTFSN